jgi:hypothetical protein
MQRDGYAQRGNGNRLNLPFLHQELLGEPPIL